MLSVAARRTWRWRTFSRLCQCSRPPTNYKLLSTSTVNETGSSTRNADTDASTKPYYITTPIFYPNADPHIGHLYSLVLADIFARYRLLASSSSSSPAPVRFITGTDEHGLKIQKAARDKGVTEAELVDALGERFKELARRANISYTRFVRTSDPAHKAGVQHLWTKLAERGLLYKSTHAGYYSITDECFYTPSQITSRPGTAAPGEVETVAQETGSTVEWAEEENWKFRLGAFRERLIAHLEANPSWIHPPTQHALVLNTLLAARGDASILPDLSVSRPRSRLSWGVRVPSDDTQTVYVWLDALSAYLTGVGYPWAGQGDCDEGKEMAKSGWPCDLHVIGKDILKFHAIYFPAFLLALDLPLPRRILSHAHWTANRTKMSKSIGNVVAPLPLLSPSSLAPATDLDTGTATDARTDTTRWYLARVGGRFRDDVDWSEVQRAKYADELRAALGNLLLRVSGAKVLKRLEDGVVFGPQESVVEGKQGQDVRGREGEKGRADWASVPLDRGVLLSRAYGAEDLDGDGEGKEWKEELRTLKDRYAAHMENLEVGEAVDAIVSVLNLANAHISHTRPWSAATPLASVVETLVWTRETLRVCGILLQPVVPGVAARLLDALGVGVIERGLGDAQVGKGREAPGAMRRVVLVPKDIEFVDAQMKAKGEVKMKDRPV